jgi:HD-like signal output (HDOD) protein
VLSISTKGLVTKLLPTKQSVAVQSDKIDIQLTAADQVIQSYPCQQLNSFTRLNQWWGNDLVEWLSSNNDHEQRTAFGEMLPIQSAPASLLVIQDQLSHINVDIAVIVKAIEKEPEHAQQLQVLASMSNRQKKPIQSIKHGLAMLGFERTNSILLQHSLLSRLNQQYFPLQRSLLTFSQFFVFIVGELATKTKLVSPELARTTAYFVVSRLFTLPSIRTLNNWERTTDPTFKLASLIKEKETENLKNDGFLLAKTWQQNKQMLEVLLHYDLVMLKQQNKRATNQYCYLIGLSLTLAQEHYFSGTTHCKETELYFKAGLTELGLIQADVMNMMTDITSSTNVFCPLERTCPPLSILINRDR